MQKYIIYRIGDTVKTFDVNASMAIYNDTGIKNGANYSYQIWAVNAVGEGELSPIIGAQPGTIPWIPKNVQVRVDGKKAILQWSPPSDDGGFEISGYRIYKGQSEAEMRLVASVSRLEYSDKDVVNDKTYFYKVSALNARGESRNSTIASVTIPSESNAGSNLGLTIGGILALVIIAVVSTVLIIRRKKIGKD